MPNPQNKTPLYNPDNQDFTKNYDINGDRNPIAFTIPAGEIVFFEPVVAEHLKKHLANHLLHKRDSVKTNVPDTLKEIYKEIEVEFDDE